VCGCETGKVGENEAQLCGMVILGELGKMEQSCVLW